MSEIHREMELFDHLLDQPEEERERFIERVCAGHPKRAERLRRLLEGHERAVANATTMPLSPMTPAAPPSEIGPYRVVSWIGEGGMGVVYAAEQQEPIRRTVAIKLIKSNADSKEVAARFHAERQALALMNHANIAKILDAGVHGDRPYFVMELIAGIPITEYCDKRRLSLAQRLDLFSQVCQGVHHAHQKGIIHRDLKPTNILVAEVDGQPTPKIIDFGIAKAVTPRALNATLHTEVGRIIGTPDYMSPEQADAAPLDIDTRSDVYSLGALLYELLTGATVFGLADGGSGIDDLRRVIAEDEPSRPSSRFASPTKEVDERAARRGSTPEDLHRILRQDLDWITLRALEKDRGRRYPSASELSNDVRRFLRGEPVVARPPSASYRLSKFARRHTAVVVSAGVVAAILIAAVAVTASFAVSERRQRQLAETANQRLQQEKLRAVELRDDAEIERDRATAMFSFLITDLLGAARPSAERGKGRDITMREVLDVAAEQIDSSTRPGGDLEGSLVVEAQIRTAIGSAYMDLGEYIPAEYQLSRSYELFLREVGQNHAVTADVLSRLGPLYRFLGRMDESERYYREAVEVANEVFGEDSSDALVPLGNLAVFLFRGDQPEEAVRLQRRVFEGRRELLGEDHELTIAAMGTLAGFLSRTGDRAEAIELMRATVEASHRTIGADHPRAINQLANLGSLLSQEQRYEEAREALEEALERSTRIMGPRHDQTGMTMNTYGALLSDLGEYQKAYEVQHAALEILEEAFGPDHPNIQTSRINVSSALAKMGRHEEAYPYSEAAVIGARKTLPEGHWVHGFFAMRHAQNLGGIGRFTEGAALAERAHASLTETRGPEFERTLQAAAIVADIYEAWNEAEPDVERARQAAEWRERSRGRGPDNVTKP